MNKKPAIPAITMNDQQLAAILRPMKENVEIMTGIRGAPLAELPSNATTAEIISTLNSVIVRLNA
jgi:hypothetical protein